MITRGRFRFDMIAQDAAELLAAFYTLEVEKRGKVAIMDENTSERICNIAAKLTSKFPKFGLMLCGTCGNGKSTMIYALQAMINYLNNRGHFTFLEDYKVGLRIMDAYDITRAAKDEDLWAKIKNHPMLAIDDLGKEPQEIVNYGNLISPMIELIEHRYNKQLFSIFSTNLVPKQIREKYGTRIADRCNEMLDVEIFNDISYRL